MVSYSFSLIHQFFLSLRNFSMSVFFFLRWWSYFLCHKKMEAIGELLHDLIIAPTLCFDTVPSWMFLQNDWLFSQGQLLHQWPGSHPLLSPWGHCSRPFLLSLMLHKLFPLYWIFSFSIQPCYYFFLLEKKEKRIKQRQQNTSNFSPD